MKTLENLESELRCIEQKIDEIYEGGRSGSEMDALEIRCELLETDITAAHRIQIRKK